MSNIEKITDPAERMAGVMARAAEAVEMAITQHGGEAVELTLLAARLDAVSHLIFGALWAAVGVLALLVWQRLTPWLRRVDWDDADSVMPRILTRLGLAAITTLVMSVAAVRLFEIKVWVGAFVPEYWIAARALESIL